LHLQEGEGATTRSLESLFPSSEGLHPRSDAKALILDIPVTEAFPSRETITNTLRTHGLQPRAIQGMLDFDYSCGRQAPSVAAMFYPFGGHHIQKFY
jgi:hypothetical protein